MKKTASFLVAGFTAGAMAAALVAQTAPQVPLSGAAGDIVLIHRTTSETGLDSLIGGVWGRSYDLGALFKGERLTIGFSTVPTSCLIKMWVAIKTAGNGNQLQQVTLRGTGSAQRTITVARDGQGVATAQVRSGTGTCGLVAHFSTTPPPGS